MTSLKQSIKHLLIKKQHNIYEKELKSKNLTYNKWIQQKEDEIVIDSSIVVEECKSLTNDFEKLSFDGNKIENDGKKSNLLENCSLMSLFDKNAKEESRLNFLVLKPETFWHNKDEIFSRKIADVILFTLYEGQISHFAPKLIYKSFQENENIILIYGDEDEQQAQGERVEPWFRPDWSPDTFLSGFYLGGLIAIRTQALEACCSNRKKQGKLFDLGKKQSNQVTLLEAFYHMLYELLMENNAFTKHDGQMPVAHIRQVLFHSSGNGYDLLKLLKLNEKTESSKLDPVLSIIIPSKDNPDVLFKCLDSILTVTDAEHRFEIILVDNGSSEDNRTKISERVEQYTYMSVNGGGIGGIFQGIRYIYQPMPFNFSDMCNLGAAQSRGNLLLFLNDDMEVVHPDWMNMMIEKAMLPYVGAVGVKLLYPASRIIQHAGITNLRVGPAHKLQFLDDNTDHYFGRNRGVQNVLAVTGACLMLRKSLYELIGGFYSGLAVAFNDVDLCYTMHEKGYYNIVRNDVFLYHHESLSRGKDGESEEKQLRLQREKDILYERHQEIYGHDPFYHPYLTNDMLESEYSPAFRYQVTLDMPWSNAHLCTAEVQSAREDKCLVVGMECAMDIYKWTYGVSPAHGQVKLSPTDNGYYFQGYSFVIGADNARYKKQLLLRNKENNYIFAIPIANRYRQDIKNNLKDQLNVDLTGFAAKLQKEQLQSGTYQFGMLAQDTCSRQKLVNWSNWVLEVKADELSGSL